MFMRVPALTRTLTIALVALYAMVSVLAGACQGAGLPSTVEHHHGQAHHGGLHAVLCALACQANLASGLVSSVVPGVQHVLLFLGMLVASCLFGHFVRPNGIRDRAPPSLSSIR